MALTVADCMKIGALRYATVVAGKGGLNRIVESVSMLEFNGFEIEGLGTVALKGHEMTISSLAIFSGHPDKFVKFMKQIKSHGFSCLVVFYVGHIMKEIPPKALELCDEAEIPLIVMPNEFNYAYVDVVMPIAEALVNDKHSGHMFVSDILQQLIILDDEQQNTHTLLEMLHDRIQSDLILIDTMFRPLDWIVREQTYTPTELLLYASTCLKTQLPLNPVTMTYDEGTLPLEIRFQPIRTNKLVGALLAVNYSEDDFDIDSLTQAAEILKLFLRVWRLTRSGLCELDALLQGGSAGQKERKIRMLTVIRNEGGSSLDLVSEELAMVNLLKYDRSFLTDNNQEVTYFSGSIVIADLTEKQSDTKALLAKLEKKLNLSKPVCAAKCSLSSGTSGVQHVYSIMIHALPIAAKIFPRISILEEKEITFAFDIYNLLLRPESANMLLEILAPLMSDDRWEKHRETLETYFLDNGANLTNSSNALNIHINTLKYRLRTISDILGQDVTSALCSTRIVFALSLLRAR